MSEPSCGRNCGGCRKCNLDTGKSLAWRQNQTEVIARGINEENRLRRDRLIRERQASKKR